MSIFNLETNTSASLHADWARRAVRPDMKITELIDGAERLKSMGAKQLGADLYKVWIAHHGDDPLLYAAYFNYAVLLNEIPDHAGALIALREAIRLKPDFFPPYINLGSLLDMLGDGDRAVGTWMSLANALPQVTGDGVVYKAMALKQVGRVLEVSQNAALAEDAMRQSLEIDPHQPEVIQHWIALRQHQCRWPVLQPWGHVKRRTLVDAISPLSAACLVDDPMFQLANAYRYSRKMVGLPARSLSGRSALAGEKVAPEPRRPGRPRIGYVSSDFREHAVGFAMTDVMELHDRSRVEVFAYYCGIQVADATQARIKTAAEHWLDLRGMTDEQVAQRIKADGIDILVDLNGYTKDARTKVFALRPAPVAVNWFGFPNTMGTPYHQYIIADETIIPPEYERYYSEKVLRLPCYQPNDRKRVVAPTPSRREAGLPENAFVYCSLNGMQKVTSPVFDRWLRILKSVPDSVLWMLAATTETHERLRQIAVQNGIAGERLVFADKKPNPQHLARLALADLFLDSFPYGAHTTASDAMWMGVPILTVPGRTFASRVCASLVRAAGIGEMVCASDDEYVNRAIAYGRDRSLLTPMRERLRAARTASLLFDTPALVKGLEGLYEGICADLAEGRVPVPDLTNLDLYQEVAAELDLESISSLSDDAYVAAYRSRLADRDTVFPVPPDRRLAQR